MGIATEFKEFAMQGNVVDMAAAAPPAPPRQEVLLQQIRDALLKR